MPHIPTRVSPTAQERCHQSVECGQVTTGTHTMTSPMKDADDENQLLASMSAETLKRLKPQLSLVHLESGKVLYGVDDKIEFVYFPRRGAMVSLLAVTEEGDTVE